MNDWAALIAGCAPPPAEDGTPNAWTLPPIESPWGFVGAPVTAACLAAAAARAAPEVELRSIDVAFIGAIRAQHPSLVAAHVLRSGRRMTATTVDIRQDDRPGVIGQALLGPRVADLVRHQAPMPDVERPENVAPLPEPQSFGEVRIARGDAHDDRAQSASHDVWVRAADLRDVPGAKQAMLAYRANEFTTGAALLTHEGISMAKAHTTLSAVITASHIVFHEPCPLGEWLLFHQRGVYAGNGWVFGRGQAFTEAGLLVASFSQEAMLRPAASGGREM